jgi:hypothetical protein
MIAEMLNPSGQCSPAVLNSAPSLSAKINTSKLEAVEARARDKLFAVPQNSLCDLTILVLMAHYAHLVDGGANHENQQRIILHNAHCLQVRTGNMPMLQSALE